MVRLSRELRMIDIESRIPELKQYLGQNRDVVAAYLYGSYGTERQTVLSDVDLGILVRRGVHHDFRKRLGIQSDVVDVTRYEDINVVILNDLPLHIQHEILSTGRLLYERLSSDPANEWRGSVTAPCICTMTTLIRRRSTTSFRMTLLTSRSSSG